MGNIHAVSTAYHSSLAEPVDAEPVSRFTVRDSVAFVADLGRGLPAEFRACDILYSEIAWRHGYERFTERAGGGAGYKEYMGTIAAIAHEALAATSPPLILVCGKLALRELPEPSGKADVNLNTGGRFIAEAVAVSYGCRLPKVASRHGKWKNVDTENLLKALAKKYTRIGDPCCGYGNSGRVFAEAGRQFVMSDLSPNCIGYIAANAGGWFMRREALTPKAGT